MGKSGCKGGGGGSNIGSSTSTTTIKGYHSAIVGISTHCIRRTTLIHKGYLYEDNVLEQPNRQQLKVGGRTFVAFPRDDRTKTFWWSIWLDINGLFGVDVAIAAIMLFIYSSRMTTGLRGTSQMSMLPPSVLSQFFAVQLEIWWSAKMKGTYSRNENMNTKYAINDIEFNNVTYHVYLFWFHVRVQYPQYRFSFRWCPQNWKLFRSISSVVRAKIACWSQNRPNKSPIESSCSLFSIWVISQSSKTFIHPINLNQW